MLIGRILKASNPDIERALAAGEISPDVAAVSYNYTNPLLLLAFLGFLALILGFVLKAIDKKKGYGLELPNIVQS
ncbi:MAG: hypothetical protein BWX66_01662 [Deltaproteobacteria bacterium ADurb.Bin058]|nr:MAG: hypothetical protein BWX66_01662 [Deltaproteobacteria bacterium ADurb.Bin058]